MERIDGNMLGKGWLKRTEDEDSVAVEKDDPRIAQPVAFSRHGHWKC